MLKTPSLFVIVLFIALVSCYPNFENEMSNSLYIPIENDLKLYVETFGKKGTETCLFISGAGANSSFWSDHLCDSLVQEGFFVVKYDHRDFGYSSKIDWDENPYDFIQLAKDAISILNSLEIEKAHVVGHSMGGFIVQLLGIHYPTRVTSLTSISASTNSPSVPPPPEETWEIYMSHTPTNNIEVDLKGFLIVWEYLNGTAEFNKEMAIKYTQNLYKRQVVDGALGASHVKAQQTLSDRTEALKTIDIPTLVMHGEKDYAVDKYGGIQTAEAIRDAELVIISKMGHIPFNQELQDRFDHEIISFILKHKTSE